MPLTFQTFDVRPILAKGGEPLPAIRARIEQLAANEGLAVMAPFLPSPLIEKLANEGFRSRVEHQTGFWITYFWRDD
jgi:hypothetical protein